MSLKHSQPENIPNPQYKSTPPDALALPVKTPNELAAETIKGENVETDQQLATMRGVSSAEFVAWTPKVEEIVDQKFRRVRTAYYSHHTAADIYSGLSQWLGFAVVVINIITGSAIFSSIGKQGGDQAKMWAGAITLLAALLAAVQTFFGFAPKKEKHRAAANRYSAIRQRLDSLSAIPRASRGDARVYLAELDKELSTATSECPEVSNWMQWISERRNKNNKFVPLFKGET